MVATQGWLICVRVLAVTLALASAPLAAGAQPVTGKVPRVGLLGVTSEVGYARQIAAMRQGFRDLGYVEGQNIVIDYRWRVKVAAAALNVELVEVPARSPQEFDDAFALMLRRRVDGLVTLSDSMLVANMRRLGELSAAKGVPGAGSDEYAEGGGLLAYGVSFPELWRRAAYFVARILKGSTPATIPVEQASKFALIINVKTATAMGLQVQQSLLLRADHIIR